MSDPELHPDFDPTVDEVVRVDPDAPKLPEEPPLNPYRIAAQIKLFKSGMMGTAVQVWSSYEGGYEPSPVILAIEGKTEPVTVHVTDPDIEDQIAFAGGYIIGWTEALKGDIDKLDIWLEPVGA